MVRPLRVTNAAHWIYTGTGLKEGDLFGQKSLHMRCAGGASGHETDKAIEWEKDYGPEVSIATQGE